MTQSHKKRVHRIQNHQMAPGRSQKFSFLFEQRRYNQSFPALQENLVYMHLREPK